MPVRSLAVDELASLLGVVSHRDRIRLIEELTPTMAVDERYRTVNMGIGMVVICAPNDAPWISDLIDEPTWRIGTVVDGPREVTLIG